MIPLWSDTPAHNAFCLEYYKQNTQQAMTGPGCVWWGDLTVSLYKEKNSISNECDLFTLSRVSRWAAAAGEPCPMLPVIASPGWANQKGPLTFSTEGVGFKCTFINDQKKYPVSTGKHYLTVLHFRWVTQLFIHRKLIWVVQPGSRTSFHVKRLYWDYIQRD